jgi:hypothetical protein
MPQVHHSDVIGSLLRPKYLTRARDAYAAGQLATPATSPLGANLTTEDVQERKLELVAEVAHTVW